MTIKKVAELKKVLTSLEVIPSLSIDISLEDFLTMVAEYDPRVKALLDGGFEFELDGVSQMAGNAMLVEVSLIAD